ncbi:MAG: DNA polymerase III subunit delta' C-terminal domain-containing protein [Patescibacteria group bacterium]
MFVDIIGHKKVCDVLHRAVQSDMVCHAYLFVGQHSIGKTQVAVQFIKNFLGTPKPELHPDYFYLKREVDEKTQKKKTTISVAQVRELKEKISMTSIAGNKKAVFVYDADYLSGPSANAMLKTLEEPKGDIVIILRAQSYEAVPLTIASRCQLIRFHSVSTKDIENMLVKKYGILKDQASQYARWSMGKPGIAVRIVSDSAYRALLETGVNNCVNLLQSNETKMLAIISKLFPKSQNDSKDKMDSMVDICELLLRDVMLFKTGNAQNIVNSTYGNEVKALLEMNTGQCIARLNAIKDVRKYSKSNINPQLALEHIFLQ